MARQNVFATCRSGVAQVCLESGRDRLTAGTAFLVDGGLVTNSHVLGSAEFDVAVIRFDGMAYEAGIRLERAGCIAAVGHESPAEEHDVVFLRLHEPEFTGRYVFQFGETTDLRVGDEVGFMGYPFQMEQLTCHVGYVSSMHRRGEVTVIQVDGSINGGNSGGPLIEVDDGRIVGIVSRAEVGFLADQFDGLIRQLQRNVEELERPRGARVVIAGLDPIDGMRASQAAMLQIAANLRRSANVGIGYAFGSNHIRDHVAGQRQRDA